MTKPINDLTRAQLVDTVLYDPIDGRFVWRYSRRGCVKQETEAGSLDPRGYLVIGINGRGYFAHRLAWLWVYGTWPKEEIDHINMIRDDNRLVNLRDATRSQNLHNGRSRKNNTHGTKGISKHKYKGKWTGQWVAQIQRNKIHHYLGLFSSKKEAMAAYRTAAESFYGEFARTE